MNDKLHLELTYGVIKAASSFTKKHRSILWQNNLFNMSKPLAADTTLHSKKSNWSLVFYLLSVFATLREVIFDCTLV